MNLDKDFQKALLELAAAAYPDWVYSIDNEAQMLGGGARHLDANACYLFELGFLNADMAPDISGKITVNRFRVTAQGIDFLEADVSLK